tara:strand:+ start:398 stop:787 length:390 start_codon:yes stop_codon:yes gene_type:complete
MANITNIIGGQPYYDATTGNSKNKLLDFWKGTQAQYNLLARTGGAISPAPSGVTSLVFTNLTTAASGWVIGDVVWVTGSSNNTTRTKGTIAAVPTATELTITMDASYTNTDTSGYQIDKYDASTLYLIT